MAAKESQLRIVIDAQNRTQAAFNSLKGNLQSVGKSYDGLISTMKGVGAASAVAFGGLSLLTKGVIEAGASYEQTQIAFTTMLGSAELAKRVLADLSRFASATPFELGQLETVSKQLLAYGTTADDLLPTLKMLGDISAGVGMDKLPQLTLAFGQVQAATKLTGAELRQFSEAGVPLLGALADKFGKTEAEIIEMVSAGEIGFQDMKDALSVLTAEGGKFNDLMSRQSTSLGGLWSNLKDQISLTARVMGTELLPYLKPVVEKLIEFAGVIRGFVAEHPKFAAGLLAGTLLLTGLLAILFPLAIALPGIVIMFGAMGTAIAAVTAISAPMLLAIGAIIAILGVLVSNGYFTAQAWEEVWVGIQVIAADAANAVIDTVEGMVNWIIDGVNTAIKYINKVIELAQKVPGLGKKINTISSISSVEFGNIDTSNLGNSLISKAPVNQSTAPMSVYVTGNTFLDQYGAERVGDLLMSKLKLSSQL